MTSFTCPGCKLQLAQTYQNRRPCGHASCGSCITKKKCSDCVTCPVCKNYFDHGTRLAVLRECGHVVCKDCSQTNPKKCNDCKYDTIDTVVNVVSTTALFIPGGQIFGLGLGGGYSLFKAGRNLFYGKPKEALKDVGRGVLSACPLAGKAGKALSIVGNTVVSGNGVKDAVVAGDAKGAILNGVGAAVGIISGGATCMKNVQAAQKLVATTNIAANTIYAGNAGAQIIKNVSNADGNGANWNKLVNDTCSFVGSSKRIHDSAQSLIVDKKVAKSNDKTTKKEVSSSKKQPEESKVAETSSRSQSNTNQKAIDLERLFREDPATFMKLYQTYVNDPSLSLTLGQKLLIGQQQDPYSRFGTTDLGLRQSSLGLSTNPLVDMRGVLQGSTRTDDLSYLLLRGELYSQLMKAQGQVQTQAQLASQSVPKQYPDFRKSEVDESSYTYSTGDALLRPNRNLQDNASNSNSYSRQQATYPQMNLTQEMEMQKKPSQSSLEMQKRVMMSKIILSELLKAGAKAVKIPHYTNENHQQIAEVAEVVLQTTEAIAVPEFQKAYSEMSNWELRFTLFGKVLDLASIFDSDGVQDDDLSIELINLTVNTERLAQESWENQQKIQEIQEEMQKVKQELKNRDSSLCTDLAEILADFLMKVAETFFSGDHPKHAFY